VASDDTLDPAIRQVSQTLLADWRVTQAEQFGQPEGPALH
jgi:hypothetical protein